MLFRRRLTVKEIDLEVYSRLNTLKFDNISFADIRDVSPFFVFIDRSEELTIDLIDAGFEDGENAVVIAQPDIFSSEVNEGCNFNDTTVKNAVLDVQTKVMNEENISCPKILAQDEPKVMIKSFSDIRTTIKEKKVKCIVVKNPVKELKISIEKKQILQMVEIIVKEHNVVISDLAFSGFYMQVPVARDVRYSWLGKKLCCESDSVPKVYMNAAGFYNSRRNERYLKFIRDPATEEKSVKRNQS